MVLLLIAVGGMAAALTVGPLRPGGSHDAPRFVDETASSGLAQTYGGDDTYDTGGGVAVFDCDGDGRPDVYLAGGAHPAALYRNESPTGGALRFTRIVSATTDLTAATGAYPLDIDSDGIPDLAVLRNGGSELLRGLGDCRFEPANETWGVHPTPGNTQAFSATWEGTATLPTMAFGQYVEPLPDGAWRCPDNEVVRPGDVRLRVCGRHPAVARLLPALDALQRLGRVGSPGPPGQQRPPLLRRAGRRGAAVALRAGRAAAGLHRRRRLGPLRLWGMGIASYDLTGDGYPEVYLTSQGANTLQTLVAGPSAPAYHGMARELGVEATRPVVGGDPLPSTAWHPEFEDVNNDGSMDLLVTKGNVNQVPDFAQKDPNNLFLGRRTGSTRRPPRRPGSSPSTGGAARHWPTSTATACSTSWWRTSGRPPGCGATSDRHGRRPAAMGGWLGVRLHQTGTEPRCHRRRHRVTRRRPGGQARARRSGAAMPAASSAGRTSDSVTHRRRMCA